MASFYRFNAIFCVWVAKLYYTSCLGGVWKVESLLDQPMQITVLHGYFFSGSYASTTTVTTHCPDLEKSVQRDWQTNSLLNVFFNCYYIAVLIHSLSWLGYSLRTLLPLHKLYNVLYYTFLHCIFATYCSEAELWNLYILADQIDKYICHVQNVQCLKMTNP